ncbi:MAG: hypothetical protein ACXABY_05405 [Candidatus Thorarchaeota archaeon]|jgi:hypothetical protein
MGMIPIGSRITVVPEDTTQIIESGASIQIFGVIVNQTGAASLDVTLSEVGGLASTIMILQVSTQGRWVAVDVPFDADLGLSVTTPVDTSCTIIHSQPGT